MLTTSAAFKNAIASEDREIRAYLKFNGSTILRGVDGLVSIEWDQSVYDEERLCIGCAVSSFITAEFFDNLTGVDFKNSYVEAFVGVVLEDTGTAPSGSIEPDTATVEYVSLGRFDITDSVTKNGKTVITAYDKLSKLSGEYTPSISAGTNGYAIADIVNDVLTQSGVGGSVSGSYGYVQKIQASTYREQLKYCLTMMVQNGSSYILDRTNDSLKMTSVIGQDATQLTITDSTTYIDGMDEQPSFTISSLQATTGTDVYTFGSGQGIEISNPYITNAQASAIYNSMEGFSYLPIRLEFRGNPAIDPGDVLTLTAGGKNTKIVAMRIRSTFNGGFKSTIDCYGNTETYYAMSEPPTGTRITQAENMIRLEAARATTAEGNLSAQITINADAISSEVTRATTAEGALSTSITQTAGQVSIVAQKLENIGGRNILRNSATAHWAPLNSPTVTFEDGVTVTEWGTNEAMRAYGTGGATRATLQFLNVTQTSAIYLADTTYTMSVYLKNNHQTNAISLGCNGSLEDVIVEPGEAKRVSLSIQGDGSTALRMYIRTPSPGDAFDFTWWHPQIEYGEVVTSWNPAPEDAEAAIAANSAAIEINATNIASKVSQTDYNGDTIASLINQTSTSVQIQASKVDLQGYVTFSNLSTSGETAINGGNITTGTISADRIGANSITAAKIDMTDLFSQNITATNFNLTGGSINITTSAQTTDVIQLNYSGSHVLINPVRIEVGASSSGGMFGDYSCVMNCIMGSIAVYDPIGSAGNYFNVTAHTGLLSLKGASTPGTIDIKSNTGNTTASLSGGNGYGTAKETALVFLDDSSTAGRPYRMALTNDGLTFRNSSDAVTAQYPSYGPAIRSTKRLTSSSSVKITFAAESVAIISAIGYLGNAYGVFLYTGYALGSARQHITKLLGDAAVSMTINESDQSVTLSYTGAATMYVSALPLYGNPPTFS